MDRNGTEISATRIQSVHGARHGLEEGRSLYLPFISFAESLSLPAPHPPQAWEEFLRLVAAHALLYKHRRD